MQRDELNVLLLAIFCKWPLQNQPLRTNFIASMRLFETISVAFTRCVTSWKALFTSFATRYERHGFALITVNLVFSE